jgi:hypothetical protein
MNLQAALDNEAIELLSKIKEILLTAKTFEYSQILARTLRETCNSNIALIDMIPTQINKFEEKLIETFKFFKWI